MAIVQRSPADKPGDDIVSDILVSSLAQIERGRQEINYSSNDVILKTGSITRSEFVKPGILVAVQDKSGQSLGMVTNFSISVSGASVSTNITVECQK